MSSLFSSFLGVFVYILIGYILKKINIISNKIENITNVISFNILLPVALITNFWLITFPNIFITKLLISFFGAGILIFIIAYLIGKNFFQFKIDESVIYGLGACFGNSVAFGIPLMFSILGKINSIPYMILVLFHGIIHFTYATLIIEGYRNKKYSYIKKIINIIIGLLKNIVLVGMFLGLTLNYFNIPFIKPIQNIFIPISNIALPLVLISMGISLGGFKKDSSLSYILILTVLKNLIYPLIAYIFAKYIFMLSPLLIFTVTLAAALPSGTQTYYFSYRYNALKNIISTNILVSTFVSFFTLSSLMFLFGY